MNTEVKFKDSPTLKGVSSIDITEISTHKGGPVYWRTRIKLKNKWMSSTGRKINRQSMLG
jgi:hypothetical protein